MKLSVVCPCYNEADDLLYREITKVSTEMALGYGLESDIIFIDDGSSDETKKILRDASLIPNTPLSSPNIHYISFSRNFGKEAAIYAD